MAWRSQCAAKLRGLGNINHCNRVGTGSQHDINYFRQSEAIAIRLDGGKDSRVGSCDSPYLCRVVRYSV